MCSPHKRWRPSDVAPDTAVLGIDGGCGGAVAVAVPRHRAGVRPHSAAAVLLLQPGRCRQPDRQMVLLRRDLEAFDDYAVGVDAGFRHRSEEHTSELQSRFGISYAV